MGKTANRERREVRAWFPSLELSQVFLDNAGGSQVPVVVADSVRDYLLNTYVQVGADYAASKRATETVEEARALVSTLMNAGDTGKVVFGPSTSALVAMLADCYGRAPQSNRNEIVVCEAGHEANVGPWVRLSKSGHAVKMWRVDPKTYSCPMSKLKGLLSERTRILAVPHVSNLLGNIDDIEEMARLAHGVGAKIVVDGVAYAPHRAMNVAEWNVDWYVYSTYKVYGPHMAALYGRHDAFQELIGPNHFFISPKEVPYKFELGGVLHEGCAGITALKEYFLFLAGRNVDDPLDRDAIDGAYRAMTELELPLQTKLIDYLLQNKSVRLVGPSKTDSSRVATVSFVHDSKSSKEIVLAANERGLGIRYGHFYAHRLATALGLDPEDGVVRTSLVHYNSEQEVERLIECFEEIL